MLSPWSKRSAAIGSILLVMAMFVACGDDDSDSATRPSGGSSSSVCEDCDDESSSSVTPKSSSSSKVSEPAEESSSSTKSSSSSAKSSSSIKNESSSSVTLEESSSSADSSNSSSSDSEGSSSSTGEAGWSWDVPKEERLNSEITYGTMTDSRDKKVYKTVKIGEQTWMAENLNYTDSAMTPSLLERSWCYNNDSANCAVAGRLYTWAAAIDSAKLYKDKSIDCGYRKTCTLPDTVYGICPPGWHLPTQVEWKTLLTEVGGQSIAGKILKSQTGWYDNGNGTDDVGFSALPAGGRDAGNGDFYAGGRLANFWSASEDDSHTAYHMSLSYEDEHANLIGYQKNYGFSVRCLQD